MGSEIKLKKNLIHLFKEENWSLSLVSRKAKMNKSTLHGYMGGVTPRGLESLVLLAEVFNVSPSDLIFGDLKAKSGADLNFLSNEMAYEIVIRPISKKGEDGLS